MGALVGMLAIIGGVALIYGLLAMFTLAKYALYRALKLGTMPLSDYFKYYYSQL